MLRRNGPVIKSVESVLRVDPQFATIWLQLLQTSRLVTYTNVSAVLQTALS